MIFKGSMVAIATPMHQGVGPDTSIDTEALDKLIDFHLDNDTDAIVAVGTTGESATLDEEEHCEVIRQTVQRVSGRVPVIAGTGANSTSEAIRLSRCAAKAGADACLSVTPYYNKPTQNGLYAHYKAIAEVVDIPQILYNVPGRTVCDMLPETIGRLSTLDNIIGIKEATAELDRVRQLKACCGDDFLLISGDDATAMEFLLAGGMGVISVTANIAPRAMHDMCIAAIDGNRAKAQAIDERLMGLHEKLFVESSPIPTKWALQQMGLIEAGIRLPLTWLTEECHDTVKQAMQQAGVGSLGED